MLKKIILSAIISMMVLSTSAYAEPITPQAFEMGEMLQLEQQHTAVQTTHSQILELVAGEDLFSDDGSLTLLVGVVALAGLAYTLSL